MTPADIRKHIDALSDAFQLVTGRLELAEADRDTARRERAAARAELAAIRALVKPAPAPDAYAWMGDIPHTDYPTACDRFTRSVRAFLMPGAPTTDRVHVVDMVRLLALVEEAAAVRAYVVDGLRDLDAATTSPTTQEPT